mgnify:CR=1 FL=1
MVGAQLEQDTHEERTPLPFVHLKETGQYSSAKVVVGADAASHPRPQELVVVALKMVVVESKKERT